MLRRVVWKPSALADLLLYLTQLLRKRLTYLLDDEGISTSKTSVNIYQTERRNIPEDSHLQINPVHTLPFREHYPPSYA
jgi:hypothetical protein